MALNLKTLGTRTLTAAVFVAVLLSCIMYSYLSFAALFFVVSIWGLYEFYQLAEKLGARPYKGIGIACGVLLTGLAIALNTVLFRWAILVAPVLTVVVFLMFVKGLFDKGGHTVLNIAYTATGLLYAVVPFMLLIFISCIEMPLKDFFFLGRWGSSDHETGYNFHYVLGIILLIWASDTGAYLVGSLIGKNKLYERISPGKTWEGSIGSAILNIGCAWLISRMYPELAFIHWAVISVLVSVFGTIGDLVESMLKRQAGVKDSGKIMPGHGGILDRFDSLLFVSPFAYAYLQLVVW